MKVHVRCQGKSTTLDAAEWGIHGDMPDNTIRSILSDFIELPRQELSKLVIDRNPDGIVIRPPAVFG
ncbi:MAG: hypothetical protein RDV48_17105 [Candidatus Eremiobacteraeota bacterium]|nr:hypothetical protein [Candidatus Eremiobacteraeota bacterium]